MFSVTCCEKLVKTKKNYVQLLRITSFVELVMEGKVLQKTITSSTKLDMCNMLRLRVHPPSKTKI